MKLKGIELKGTYKVEFYDAYFEVYDTKSNRIYFENSGGYWAKNVYDERNNVTYFEDSDGKWSKREYDERNNQTYYEDSDGDWFKKEYDEKGNEIYYEDSEEKIVDNRLKELTVEEIEKLLGYKIKVKGEKK